MALGVGLGSLRIVLASQFDRRWCSTAPAKLHNAALCKVAVSQSQASFVSSTAGAPYGFTQQALCKIAYADPGLSAVGVPRSLRVLHAVACHPSVVLAPGQLVRRYALCFGQWPAARYPVFAPAHPWGLLASQHRPRGLPVRPPRGLPQNRAGRRRASDFVLSMVSRFGSVASPVLAQKNPLLFW